jgi:hypothetical protein
MIFQQRFRILPWGLVRFNVTVLPFLVFRVIVCPTEYASHFAAFFGRFTLARKLTRFPSAVKPTRFFPAFDFAMFVPPLWWVDR